MGNKTYIMEPILYEFGIYETVVEAVVIKDAIENVFKVYRDDCNVFHEIDKKFLLSQIDKYNVAIKQTEKVLNILKGTEI